MIPRLAKSVIWPSALAGLVLVGSALPSWPEGEKARCDYYDHAANQSEYGNCTVDENMDGDFYRWVLTFDNGSRVVVTEDTKARAAARSWKINGSPGIGIEVNRLSFRGATIDLERSVQWSFEASVAASAASASENKDVQYDSKTALQAQQFNQVVLETTVCLRDAIKTALRLGRRNRTDIISWATQVCGIKFFYVYKLTGRPQQEGRAYLIALAEAQLNEVLKSGQ